MVPPPHIDHFRYDDLDIDEAAGALRMRYSLDDQWSFEEMVHVEIGRGWSDAATEAARLVYLLSGISYYKAAAPAVIDLGSTPVRDGEIAFLHDFYVSGLGEFAYRNGLGALQVRVTGGGPPPHPLTDVGVDRNAALIPFGGGIDSIVTVEDLRQVRPGSRLFIVNSRGDRFDTIERAAAVTGLDVVRADRHLDTQVLRSREVGFLNGHVPVTGILSSLAVLAAVLQGAGEVVMSNEWSSSIGNVEVDGVTVNHQYSKSWRFEQGFRAVLEGALPEAPTYYSHLRSRSELWVAERFATLSRYHDVFHSCNRAFHIDPARRLARWCGRCDKCCFIDLVLAPFMDRNDLARIFDGREPLDDVDLLGTFRTLLALDEDLKPFECVGDVDECRVAAAVAATREDRAGSPVLSQLVAAGDLSTAAAELPRMLRPLGPTNAPAALLD